MEGQRDIGLEVFTWTIENFSKLNTNKHFSEIFRAGGHKWQVLIFPTVNNVNQLSMYVAIDSTKLAHGWSTYAAIELSVVNQVNNHHTVQKGSYHKFNARESDFGFASFMPLIELKCSSKGFLVNDTLIIKAKVAICDDPKKKTGYVGLKNQGSTSYLNTLLQTLFHLPYFRKAVYHLQPVESDIPSRSIIRALQSLFYELQYGENSVKTENLTKSFGWNESETSMLHDAQEFNRVLCEKLEEKMKGTAVEGTIQQMFGGQYLNYIDCTNVNCSSARVETFYDLQLDVRGCNDVYASLDKYVSVERLEGDNRYRTQQDGLQDARKGLLFIDFPPVLQLHLKRFEYDSARDTALKINDRFEFPLDLDLDIENGKYLSPMADRTVRNLFTLHSVLVHSVGVHGGHYHAYIRPNLSDQWLKFDDEQVIEEDMKRALEDQYGGQEERITQVNSGFDTSFRCTKWSNAYMLVYIRKSDAGVICNVNQEEITGHLLERLKSELEGKNIRKNLTMIKVARTEDLIKQIGRDIYFDLVDYKKVRRFCTEKSMLFYDFKEEVAKAFGIPVQFQRYWLWAKRQNNTYRPHRPLTLEEEKLSVKHTSSGHAIWNLFLEVEHGTDLHLIQPPNLSNTDIMIFLKLYDPIKEELRYVGRLFVKITSTPSQIVTKLNLMAGFSPLQCIELYEEIKFEPSIMCEHIDKELTFRASQFENGDIICMQKSPPVKDLQKCRYPDVPSFFEHLQTKLKVEQEVKELKESEVDLYIDIKVALDNDLVKQIGIEIYFDLVDHNKVHCFHLKKWSPFHILKDKVAKEFDVPVQFQRYWLCAKRQNLSYRPFRPLTPEEESKSFGHYLEVACHTELKLFLEIELGQDLYPIQPPINFVDHIILFFKLYDPSKEQLCYVGRLFVNSYGKPSEILEKLNELAFFPSSQEIELYEEIKSEPSVMCDLIEKNSTFRASQLENGDIVCFQKSSSVNNMSQYRFPDVPSYLHYVRNRQVVRFRSLRKPKVDAFTLELSKFSLYGEVVEMVACELGIHYPSKIRLTPHNSITRQPTQTPIVDRSVDLSAMLLNGNQSSDIVYYDVLETSKAESGIRSASCVICLDAPKESACIPCGHLSACESCLKKIKDRNGGCPICRSNIQEVIRIYTA